MTPRSWLLLILGIIAFGVICFYSGKISERRHLDTLMLDAMENNGRLIEAYDRLLSIHLRVDHKYKPAVKE